MAILKKKIKLDLSNVPTSDHKAVKNAVGDYIINQVLRDIERGFSPVDGEGQFKQLTPAYAKAEKGGRRTANLQLEGDLKEAIQFRRTKDGIEYGNFAASEKNKSDGHNQHSGKAKAWAKKNNFPKRRYIPEGKQKFRQGIEREIRNIVQEFEEQPIEDLRIEDTATKKSVGVDLFSDEAIEAEIKRQLSNEV